LIAARALLEQNSSPSIEDVQEGMSGNLCRCTGYNKIIDAVRNAAQRLQP
jgi:aerobic-type carbon monoxide dehydrogenase small subunit (CoxS/CutS family)